jgi:hypothetical protein
MKGFENVLYESSNIIGDIEEQKYDVPKGCAFYWASFLRLKIYQGVDYRNQDVVADGFHLEKRKERKMHVNQLTFFRIKKWKPLNI